MNIDALLNIDIIWIAQAIGLFTMALDIYATLHKNDRTMVIIHGITAYIWSVHFLMLGAIPGAFAEALNGTRTLGSVISFLKPYERYIAFIFVVIYVILIIWVPKSLIAALPLISSIIITMGLYLLQGVAMRLCWLCGFILCLIYAISVSSIGAVILLTTLTCTSSYRIFKIIRKNKHAV